MPDVRTGLPEDNFGLVYAALFNSMDRDPDSPLYWGKAGTESSAGRRCSASPRQMLFMYFEHKRHGMSQDYNTTPKQFPSRTSGVG